MPSSIGGVPKSGPEGAEWLRCWGGDGVLDSDFMVKTPLEPTLEPGPDVPPGDTAPVCGKILPNDYRRQNGEMHIH